MPILRRLVSQTPVFSFSFVDLLIGSLPVGSQTLLKKLEQGREVSSADAAPKADAIVVLSGMLRMV